MVAPHTPQDFHSKLVLPQTPTEAGGIAWAEVFTKTGAKINLTSRADNPIDALDNLYVAIEYAITEKSCTTERPSVPASETHYEHTETASNFSAPAKKKPPEVADYKVRAIAHTLSKNGTAHFLKVLPVDGYYKTYGVNCFPDIVPEDIRTEFLKWPVDKEYTPTPSTRFVRVQKPDPGYARVIMFPDAIELSPPARK